MLRIGGLRAEMMGNDMAWRGLGMGGDVSCCVNRKYLSFKEEKFFGDLDGLRFLAIAAVIWHHGFGLFVNHEDFSKIYHAGFIGVDLFFVLSGFLITTLLLREHERFGRVSLPAFWMRRARRLLPAYFILIAFVTVFVVVLKGDGEGAYIIPFYIFFMSNFLDTHLMFMPVTWSLAVEQQFYLLWPILFVMVPRRFLVPVVLVLIAANVLGVMGAFASLGVTPFSVGPLTFKLPNATYAPLLMGALVAMALHSRRVFAMVWPVLGHVAAAPVGLLALVLVVEMAPVDLRGLPNLAIHTVMCVLVASCVIRDWTPLSPFLRLGPVRRIGEISYGIYLFHLIGLGIAMKASEALAVTSPLVTFVLYCVTSVIIAETSWRLVESRFHRRASVAVGATPQDRGRATPSLRG